MTPEQWQTVRPILESALELDPTERASFLEDACKNAFLRGEVESLLASHDGAGAQMLAPGAAPILGKEDEPPFSLPAGRRIGAYEILEEIALGGMGAVFRALRADGQYEQQVALKIVRADLGSELVAARFRNERQILATLDHPNIAKILDGGVTSEGVPYLVMEFIDGLPVTEYCDKHKLSIEARLKLLRTICSAVHYAHQHLIIHRDIKPGNILVTPEGIPKLLDFGIAKILDPGLRPNATLTRAALCMMTPEYASPEQLRGEAITTATDVYSLGTVLYELLTGSPAYNFSSRMPHEIARVVLETDPKKPSAAIQRKGGIAGLGEKAPPTEVISGARGDSPEKLRKRISGDLDNIVMKAIRKELGERYTSADQLSEDIRRHLEHLPILARKSTLAYRCRMYVLRHKMGVAAAALVFVSLLMGIALTLREARIARVNQLRAERRFNDVRKLANSLMFEINDSIQQLPGATAARKLITQRAQEYLDSLAQESANDPALLRELATAYGKLADVQGNVSDANLGDTPSALKNYREAIALLESASSLQPSNRELRRELAHRYLDLSQAVGLRAGNKAEYKSILDKAVDILEPLATANPEDATTEDVLALAYMHRARYLRFDNDFPGSLNHDARALAIFERLVKTEPDNDLYRAQISNAHRDLGAVLSMQKQWSAALEHYRISVQMDEAQVARHPESVNARFDLSVSYSNTGFILVGQGESDVGLNYYLKALKIRSALVAADPEDTKALGGLAYTYNYIGGIYERDQSFLRAIEYHKKALAIDETLLRKDPTSKVARENAAWIQEEIGQEYAAMAARSRVPGDELRFCRESVSWLQLALPILLQRKTEGRFFGAEELETPQRTLDKCRQTIARQSTHSPPP